MQYETLYLNDNNTAKVHMTIGDSVLEQDFDVDNLDENVKQGMAIFQVELDRNQIAPIANIVLDKPIIVTTLPVIPPAAFQPEQPADTPVDTAAA